MQEIIELGIIVCPWNSKMHLTDFFENELGDIWLWEGDLKHF